MTSQKAGRFVDNEPEEEELKAPRSCPICGDTDHISPFACPHVSPSMKRKWQRLGGKNKGLRPTYLKGHLLRRREGRKSLLITLLGDVAKLPNSPQRARMILQVIESYRREFKAELDDDTARLFEEAARLAKAEKAGQVERNTDKYEKARERRQRRRERQRQAD
jgi:hypothetical protein